MTSEGDCEPTRNVQSRDRNGAVLRPGQGSLTRGRGLEMQRSFEPIAYLLTWTTYGTWLHGDERGSVDDERNVPGTPVNDPQPKREWLAVQKMSQPAYVLVHEHRELVLTALHRVCAYRLWTMHAAHVRTNHVHIVVSATATPERILIDFKAYASRALNEAGHESLVRNRWTRHGSTRYLWDEASLLGAIDYVVDRQGSPVMSVYRRPTDSRP